MTEPRFRLRQAAARLHAGGVIGYPTEAVYGLGCDPLNPLAVNRLLRLKGRAAGKGLILIAADPNQLVPYLLPLTPRIRQRVRPTWPGPVTWLLPAAPEIPEWLTGGRDVLAVRVTAHPVAAALCRAFGAPLVSTSANPSGQPPARSALQVRHRFGSSLDDIVPGATGGLLRPTEIRDGRTGRILRPGA